MTTLAKQYRENLRAFDKAETGAEQAELCAQADGIAQAAFAAAISDGRLSRDKDATNFAGDYMFMGFNEIEKALFKNKLTREYLV